jgi:hypothetical protein
VGWVGVHFWVRVVPFDGAAVRLDVSFNGAALATGYRPSRRVGVSAWNVGASHRKQFAALVQRSGGDAVIGQHLFGVQNQTGIARLVPVRHVRPQKHWNFQMLFIIFFPSKHLFAVVIKRKVINAACSTNLEMENITRRSVVKRTSRIKEIKKGIK